MYRSTEINFYSSVSSLMFRVFAKHFSIMYKGNIKTPKCLAGKDLPNRAFLSLAFVESQKV